MIFPPSLAPGDLVAVVAPAGPARPAALEAGEAVLAARYRLLRGAHVGVRRGYLAGGDEERLGDLLAALDHPEVRAVFCARGGYGTLRLAAALGRELAARPPRLLVGFSDITVLHALLLRRGVASIHGPVVTQLGRLPPPEVADLLAFLEGGDAAPWEGLETVVPGEASGPLVGGNLEVLTRLLGTPFFPPVDGAVLALEEVGEAPYRLDRALTQLELAGLPGRVAAVVVGHLERCEGSADDPAPRDVVAERLSRWGVPVVLGAPFGHRAPNRPFLHGGRVRVGDGAVRFLEAPRAAAR